MRHTLIKFSMALGLAFMMADFANAGSDSVALPDQQNLTNTAFFMPENGPSAVIPFGYIDFCTRTPSECLVHANEPEKITLDDSNWAALQNINASVNDAIWPEDDLKHYGRAEYWTIPTDGYGDCDDYALTKRHELISKGFPEPALRLAVVITSHNQRHTVLTISTDRGDYVLDNLTNSVKPWSRTGYIWIERQIPKKPFSWEVVGASTTQVASSNSAPTSQTGN